MDIHEDHEVREALDVLTGWCRPMEDKEKVEICTAILNRLLERQRDELA